MAIHTGSLSQSSIKENLLVLLLFLHTVTLFFYCCYLLKCVSPLFHVSLLRLVFRGSLQNIEVEPTLPSAVEVTAPAFPGRRRIGPGFPFFCLM